MRAKRAGVINPSASAGLLRLFVAQFCAALIFCAPYSFSQTLDEAVSITPLSKAKVSVKVRSAGAEGGAQTPFSDGIDRGNLPKNAEKTSAESAAGHLQAKKGGLSGMEILPPSEDSPRAGDGAEFGAGGIPQYSPQDAGKTSSPAAKPVESPDEAKTAGKNYKDNFPGAAAQESTSTGGKIDVGLPSEEKTIIPFQGLPAPENLGRGQNDEIFYRNTNCFSLISKDSNILSDATVYAREAERIFSESFGFDMHFTRPILLQIFEADDSSMKGNFSVEYGSLGNVSISAKWADNLPLDGFCRLLVGAMLSKIAYEYCGGVDVAESDMPRWAYLGFSRELENNILQNGTYNDARAARDMQISYSSVMELGKADVSEPAVLASFWAVKVFKSMLGQSEFAVFLRSAIRGASAEDLKGKLYPSGKFSVPFEAYFACAVKGEILARTGGILSPEESREEIRYLCVPAFTDAEGVLTPIADTAFLLAPSSRASEWALSTNLRRIKAMLTVVNPIYYDSLLQLGIMCETALEGDNDAFYSARDLFIKDFEAALKLEKRTRGLLSGADNAPSQNINSAEGRAMPATDKIPPQVSEGGNPAENKPDSTQK